MISYSDNIGSACSGASRNTHSCKC